MKRRTLVSTFAVPLLSLLAPVGAFADEVQIEIPLRIAKLGDKYHTSQIGKAIQVTNLADADRQISTILINGLQDLGLSIETPPLDVNGFLVEETEWRTNQREIGRDWIAAHNASGAVVPLPGKRIYAVQYVGRYQYAGNTLRIVLEVSLFERSRFGAFQRTRVSYSSRFFADKLEHAIVNRLPGG